MCRVRTELEDGLVLFCIAVVDLEVRHIYVRYQGWLYRLAFDLVPISVAEPYVLLDLSDALLAIFRLFFEEAFNEIFDLSRQIWLIKNWLGI